MSLSVISGPADSGRLICRGLWTLPYITDETQTHFVSLLSSAKEIDLSEVEALDMAGAWFLFRHIKNLELQGFSIKYQGVKTVHQKLFSLIEQQYVEIETPLPKREAENFFYEIGEKTVKNFYASLEAIAFLGEMIYETIMLFFVKRGFAWRHFLNTLDKEGFRALPIIAILNFLIGIVLVYQMGQQLKLYGANIFIVNGAGLAILREFSPLITAIIAAGRTASAYAAQLGMMQINEEIDALKTLGISPVFRLILPKILGLTIALPLMTVWADLFGIFGAMFMSQLTLDIQYSDFIIRFHEVISEKTYWMGLIKAPVFGLVIACVGAYQGSQVVGTAESLGERTTWAVVQSIFLIIVVDAIFSMIFSWRE